MTPDEQRAAIAEACGWQYHGPEDMATEAWGCWSAPGADSWRKEPPPDYLRDLNACHEMERSLTDLQKDLFADHLFSIVEPERIAACDRFVGSPELSWRGAFQMINAQPLQRCEAFLRTRNLWRE